MVCWLKCLLEWFKPMVYGFPRALDMDMNVNQWIDEQKKKRMVQGQKKHGPLNLKTDPRDFIQEGTEELIDFLNYLEIAMYQGKMPFCKWASLDKDCRFVIWRLKNI